MDCYGRLLLLAALTTVVGPGLAGGEVVVSRGAAGGAGGAGGPQFPAQATAARGVRGGAATLTCYVLNLGDKAVSWVRSRDLQILTHGGAAFTADARVSSPPAAPAPAPAPAAPAPAPGAPRGHALRIERLRAADAGRYECQINTEPKMSLAFSLEVLDEAEAAAAAAARQWGVRVWAERGAVRGRAGGAAELACAARLLPPASPAPAALNPAAAPAPALELRWLRDGAPLLLEEGVAVTREEAGGRAASRLRLAPLHARLAGRYSCAASLAPPAAPAPAAVATVVLAVDGETDEGGSGELEHMQRDQWAAGGARGGAGGAVLAAALLAALAAR